MAQKRWRVGYLLIQGFLVLVIIFVLQRPELVLPLFASLIGVTLGWFGLTRLAMGSVIAYLMLTALSYYTLGGSNLIADWASPVISTMLLLIIFIILYRRQVEAQEHSQELLAELEVAHHQLVDYATQVENLTLATERQRMARELHDTLAQGVAGLVLQLEATAAHLENDRILRAQAIIQQSMKQARNTLAESRAAIDDLRLETHSLSEIIHHHTTRFTQATGISCHLKVDLATEAVIPSAINEYTERIISEGLANITRHAQADNVWLTVKQVGVPGNGERLHIDLRDDGAGFNVETAIRAGHYGLLGLRERVRLVDGRFEIASTLAQGTQLSISLPLEVS